MMNDAVLSINIYKNTKWKVKFKIALKILIQSKFDSQ